MNNLEKLIDLYMAKKEFKIKNGQIYNSQNQLVLNTKKQNNKQNTKKTINNYSL